MTFYKQVVYPGDGEAYKPTGQSAAYSMYTSSLPTQAGLAAALETINVALANTGYTAKPEFSLINGEIGVLLRMSNWQGVPVEDPIDLGALLKEANADGPDLFTAIKRWQAKHSREEQPE